MSILMQDLLFGLNNNPIITAICVFFINCGGRYILNDISQDHEKIFRSTIFRTLTVASILYISTRNILITFVFTAIYLFIIDCLWNKHSIFCIFKKQINNTIDYIDDNIIDIIDDNDNNNNNNDNNNNDNNDNIINIIDDNDNNNNNNDNNNNDNNDNNDIKNFPSYIDENFENETRNDVNTNKAKRIIEIVNDNKFEL